MKIKDSAIIFTIGHSNHTMEVFLELLGKHNIDVVVDVRSSPYSKYSPCFSKKEFQRFLKQNKIKYLFLGGDLGGKPDGEEFYDDDGYVLYGRIAAQPQFHEGIKRLLEGINNYRIVLLCSEENPTNCHRRLMLGRVLGEHKVKIIHIRGDGSVESEEKLAKEEEFQKTKGQMSLLDIKEISDSLNIEETDEWKSTRSVLQKRMQQTSLKSSSETK